MPFALSPRPLFGALFGLVTMAMAMSMYSCGPQAAPNAPEPEVADNDEPKATANRSPEVPQAPSPAPTATKVSPEALQTALVAEFQGDTAGSHWRTAGMEKTPKCANAEVAVTRRFEAPETVVFEATVTFSGPAERASTLWWVDTDDDGKARAVELFGDGVFHARCRRGCDGVVGACPPPRLQPAPAAQGPMQRLTATSKADPRNAQAYRWLIKRRSAEGGFERYIDVAVRLEDAASGRVRRGVTGFVDGLRRVEEAFPDPQTRSEITLTPIGAWVLARYTWSVGKLKPVRVAELARFKDARLVWSRGYANPMAFHRE